MLQAVIFDMDGVLMDSEDIHFEVERDILRHYGVEHTIEGHSKYVGRQTIDLWKGVCVDHGLDANPEELTKLDHNRYMDYLLSSEIKPIDGIRDLVRSLKTSQIKMIVASSASRKNIEVVIEKFQMGNDFDGYVSGQDVKESKPNPEIFMLAASRLGVDATDCVVIEDACHGVEAAKAAGTKCIAYRNPGSGLQDLSKADVIVNAINEIDLDMLNELMN